MLVIGKFTAFMARRKFKERYKMVLRPERIITKKFNKAMVVLHKEQKRRETLPIRSFSYIGEIKFMRKFIRSLYKKLALFKNTDGKYHVLLTEEQWQEIKGFYEARLNYSQPRSISQPTTERFENIVNQIKMIKGE